MDEALFRALNGALSGPGAGWLMVKITEPSTWYIPIAALCLALLAVDRRRGTVAIVSALLAFVIGDALATHVLKPLFGRARPCAALEGVHLLVGCGGSLSFPSNHAVNSMAIAAALGGVFRPLLWLTLPAAGFVMLSRVAVGVHYPSDVLAGGALGFGLGWGAAYIGGRIAGEKR
ncbi:MAG: phosphatase PAP2 family protein [Candidatus Nitrospinota bacterium M3_3B_026]